MKRIVGGITILVIVVALVFHDLWFPGLKSSLVAEKDFLDSLDKLKGLLVALIAVVLWFFVKRKHPKHQVDIPNPATSAKDPLILYYTELRHTCERLDLSIIDHRFEEYYRKVRINLPAIYQDMQVVRAPVQSDDNVDQDETRFSQQQRKALVDAAAADELKYLVVSGDVGSGKSLFVDYLTWAICGSHLGEAVNGIPQIYSRVPVIRLRLRSVALRLKQALKSDDFLPKAMQSEILTLVGEQYAKAVWNALEMPLLDHGVILLDGLDEVPLVGGLRASLLDAVDDLLVRLGEDARVVITSRPYVFEKEEYWPKGFEGLELVSMSNDQIERFLKHWYVLMRGNRNWSEDVATDKAAELFNQILDREYLIDPARSPLILTLLASLHFSRNVLPHSRAELYEQAISLMTERWTQRALDENPEYPLEDFERKILAESATKRKDALQSLALDANRNETLQISETSIKGLFSDYVASDCNPANLLDFYAPIVVAFLNPE